MSVDHNDLHDRNVLPAGANGRFRYYDWGDSVVAPPHAELVETLELACRTGKIARALTWVRATQDEEVGADWARAPLQTLVSLLDASHLRSS